MILTCAHCRVEFEAGANQLAKWRRGQTSFVCSSRCRASRGREIRTIKGGFQRLSAKVAARQLVAAARRRGELAKPSFCERCKKSMVSEERNLHAHHYAGYDKPLIVQWLCVACHKIIDVDVLARGERCRRSMLTENDIVDIRARLQSGQITKKELAQEFGVSSHAIRLIEQRKNWKHVP